MPYKNNQLSGEVWNGVPLYQGEAYGSWRARLTAVSENRFAWHRLVVRACHDVCPNRELLTDIYYEKGSVDPYYPQRRLEVAK